MVIPLVSIAAGSATRGREGKSSTGGAVLVRHQVLVAVRHDCLFGARDPRRIFGVFRDLVEHTSPIVVVVVVVVVVAYAMLFPVLQHVVFPLLDRSKNGDARAVRRQMPVETTTREG